MAESSRCTSFSSAVQSSSCRKAAAGSTFPVAAIGLVAQPRRYRASHPTLAAAITATTTSVTTMTATDVRIQSDEEFNAWWAAEDNPGFDYANACAWICAAILIVVLLGGHIG